MNRPITLDDVRCALAQPLPGATAQARMATRPRSLPEEFGYSGPPRRAAVIALLYPCDGQLCLPLTKRTQRVATHKGQISLPGGAVEPDDPTPWEAATREAHEEVGVDPGAVHYIGRLSTLYIPPSHYEVSPFVGYVPFRPLFAARVEEVAEMIEMPLDVIVDPAAKREAVWELRGRPTVVPQYIYGDHVIWGATAMILGELEYLLEQGAAC